MDLTCSSSGGMNITYSISNNSSWYDVTEWIIEDFDNFLINGTSPISNTTSIYKFYIESASPIWEENLKKLISIRVLCQSGCILDNCTVCQSCFVDR